MRHTVWESNKKYIDGHNEHARTLGFTLAMNEFGDLVCIRSRNKSNVVSLELHHNVFLLHRYRCPNPYM